MLRLSSPIGDIQDHHTVVVIGSGYGGGIAASRMARASQSVRILEQAAYFPFDLLFNGFGRLFSCGVSVSSTGRKRQIRSLTSTSSWPSRR